MQSLLWLQIDSMSECMAVQKSNPRSAMLAVADNICSPKDKKQILGRTEVDAKGGLRM